MSGMLIAFEGLDQSGKETQARMLRDRLGAEGRETQILSFPAYDTPVGSEIARALNGERDFGPDVMQLLFVANRHERREQIEASLARGAIVLCDRYRASSIAYGEAQGLDVGWLSDIQRFLPMAHLTVFIDIAPDTAVRRKARGRDVYERDLDLLARVRASYVRQSQQRSWIRVDGERPKELIAAEVFAAVDERLVVRRP